MVPSYHPAFLMRGRWPHITTAIFDVEHKARRLVAGPAPIQDAECIVPTSGAAVVVALESIANRTDRPVAIDVEGDIGSLLCVGFCQEPPHCVVVPTRRGWWGSEDELLVRAALRMVLASPVPKVMHNMVYDLEVLEYEGWEVVNCIWDTMLLAHLCFPELPKRLDYWRSVLTWVQPYKHMIREKEDK